MKGIGSGVNNNGPQCVKLWNDPAFALIEIEPKDRLTRFGLNSIALLWRLPERRIQMIRRLGVADAQRGQDDWLCDCVRIVPGFCARFGVQRCSKRKTGRLMAELAEPAAASAGES